MHTIKMIKVLGNWVTIAPSRNLLYLPSQYLSSVTTDMSRAQMNSGDQSPKVESDPCRLSKYIANTGICSRREAEKLISSGRVIVNGVVSTSMSQLVHTHGSNRSLVMVDGVKLSSSTKLRAPRLWVVYKQRGELITTADPKKTRNLLLDRISPMIDLKISNSSDVATTGKLVPINRLDCNTEGLCLVTNNGKLAQIMNCSSTLKREYRVRVHGLITDAKLIGMRRGVFADGRRQKPMEVTVETKSSTISWLKITTSESSNRAVCNSIKQLHLDVTRMISTAFGPYKFDLIPESGVVEVKLNSEISKEFYNSILTR